MQIEVTPNDGEPISFECEDTLVSNWVSQGILRGETYPHLTFVTDVRTILDVGANCGAASVFFASRYPDATVHAFEPGSRQRAIFERNASTFDNVRIHPFGLHATDQELPLYFGDGDSGMSSVIKGPWTLDEHEIVTLRNASDWASEQRLETIDLLKVDAEGCEPDVIASLAPWVENAQVVYVEYDSYTARRTIAEQVERTHELFIGKISLNQGECTYVRRDLADSTAASDWLASIFA